MRSYKKVFRGVQAPPCNTIVFVTTLDKIFEKQPGRDSQLPLLDQWMPSAADHEMLRMSKKPPMPLSLRSLKGSNWTASPASRLISK
jgi:hypothetical protein